MRALILAFAAVCFIPAPVSLAASLTKADEALAALAEGEPDRARALAEPLAARGDAVAAFALGQIYEQGLGVRPNIGMALEHYSAAAVAGNADAQLALGRLAYEGGGVYPDYERAAGWFRLAAATGDPRADVRLGLMLGDGRGVAKDKIAAARHFAKAAAKNDADGLFYLGFALMSGDGVSLNYDGAARNFAAAAEQGHAEAAYHLALLYESTALGRPDAVAAARAMKRAAEGGHKPAYAAMGLIVHRGDAQGVAADWFERGANAGDPQAALLYAVALSRGDGRTRNLAGAAALAERIASSPSTPPPLRAQAARLQQTLARRVAGPITLRE